MEYGIWNVLIPVTRFGQIRDTFIFNRFYFYFHPHLEDFHSFDAFWTNPRRLLHGYMSIFGIP